MKKNLITVCCILVTYLSFGQQNLKEYLDLVTKAKSLYEAKDFDTLASVPLKKKRTVVGVAQRFL